MSFLISPLVLKQNSGERSSNDHKARETMQSDDSKPHHQINSHAQKLRLMTIVSRISQKFGIKTKVQTNSTITSADPVRTEPQYVW